MKSSRSFLGLSLVLCLVGCGYSSVDNNLVGQPKKVQRQTPLVCDNYSVVDVSLGVMRDGVGSLSTEDKWLVVPSQTNLDKLNEAIANGKLVKITYDERRMALCQNTLSIVKSVKLLDNVPEQKK